MLCFKAFHQVSNILGISIGLNSLCPISFRGSKTSRKISTAIGSLGKLKISEIEAKKHTFFLLHLVQDLIHCCVRIYIPLPEEAARQRMLEHFLKDRMNQRRSAVQSHMYDVCSFYGSLNFIDHDFRLMPFQSISCFNYLIPK